MSTAFNIVAVSGGAWRPSRTLVLTEALIAALGQHLDFNVQVIELGDIARPVGGALSRSELPADVEAQLAAIEQADLLIVAAPVWCTAAPTLASSSTCSTSSARTH